MLEIALVTSFYLKKKLLALAKVNGFLMTKAGTKNKQ